MNKHFGEIYTPPFLSTQILWWDKQIEKTFLLFFRTYILEGTKILCNRSTLLLCSNILL